MSSNPAWRWAFTLQAFFTVQYESKRGSWFRSRQGLESFCKPDMELQDSRMHSTFVKSPHLSYLCNKEDIAPFNITVEGNACKQVTVQILTRLPEALNWIRTLSMQRLPSFDMSTWSRNNKVIQELILQLNKKRMHASSRSSRSISSSYLCIRETRNKEPAESFQLALVPAL